MGGQNSEINLKYQGTCSLKALISSRKTSVQLQKKLELADGVFHTASKRGRRCLGFAIGPVREQRNQLILETGGAAHWLKGVVDAYPKPFEAATKSPCATGKQNAIVGIEIPQAQQLQCLQRLGLGCFPVQMQAGNWAIHTRQFFAFLHFA